MKTYLSQQERVDMVMLCCLFDLLDSNFKEWKKRGNLSGVEVGLVEVSCGNLLKFVTLVLTRLDPNASKRLKADIKATKVFCLPEKEAIEKTENYFKSLDDEIVEVKKEIFYTIAERALQSCTECTKVSKGCILKTAYLEAGIPACNESPDECPFLYSQKKVKGITDDEFSHLYHARYGELPTKEIMSSFELFRKLHFKIYKRKTMTEKEVGMFIENVKGI